MEATGTPISPLSWTNELVAITGYDGKYLTLRETGITCLLGKFEVIYSCTMIELWLEGYDSLYEYMSKPCITWYFLLVSLNSLRLLCIILQD